jgi:serine phosphatase RsbU (regulator of sigma subunit)
MFSRWKKIDIAIAILFVITNISYLFIPDKTFFHICLWTLIAFASGRLLLLFKKKLLWKIRNRLLFSGLFIVATPIFFILIFFYVMSYILIAHYEVVILNKIMNGRLVQLEQIADKFLDIRDPDEMKKIIESPVRFDQEKLNIFLFKKIKGTFTDFYKHPRQEFAQDKLVIRNFKGYFLVNNNLYHGVSKQKGDVAVLISNTITQDFLDGISTLSDIKIKYRHPYGGSSLKILAEVTGDPEIMNDESSFFPYLFDYKFLDFNTIENSKPREENARFLLKVDFKKLYNKILTSNPGSVQNDTFRFVILLIVIFFPFIAFSFFIGFRMIRVITRSINQITKGTQKIRNGDFSFRIKTRSKDELQYLGESFNEMAAGIDRLLIEEKEKQRLEEELRIARSIQLKLLPPDTFESDEFEIAAVNIPAAEIAGDYFDYFYEKEKSLSVLVADVSGKGAPAAFYMAELKGLINHLHTEEMSPASLICECQESLSDSLDKVTFITMVIARFIIPEQKFVLARAGHTQALFFNAKEGKCHELFPEGVAIGLKNFSREKLKELEVTYDKGDILFLFSDGLSEILNKEDEMIGVKNLKNIIRENSSGSAEEIKQKMLDFAIKFSETEINHDDLTFIVLKVKC